MKRCSTEVCSITLPLRVEKWQADRLNMRFELGRQLYNTLLYQRLKDYNRLKSTQAYRELSERMDLLFYNNEKQSQEYRDLSKKRTLLLKNEGFTEFGFISAIRPLYKCFRNNIDSNIAPVIAQDVWKAFKNLLFGSGKRVYPKKPGEMNVLSGLRSRSSIRFFKDHIWFNGLNIPVKIDGKNAYEQEMISHPIKFCRVIRKQIKGRYQYYVQLVLEGIPALKRDKCTGEVKDPLGTGSVGLHVGIESLTYVSEIGSGVKELAESSKFQAEKRLLEQKMDRSMRAQNPGCVYFSKKQRYWGGRIKKSNHYRKLQIQYRELRRKESCVRTYRQNLIANEILRMGNQFYTGKVSYALLAKRSGQHPAQKGTGFGLGAVIGDNAPSTFLRQLDRKIRYRGGEGVKAVPLKSMEFIHSTTQGGMNLYIAILLQKYGEDVHSIQAHLLEGEYRRFISA